VIAQAFCRRRSGQRDPNDRSVALMSALRELEHRAGVEPANAGFADLCVSHFATGALEVQSRSCFQDKENLTSKRTTLPSTTGGGPGDISNKSGLAAADHRWCVSFSTDSAAIASSFAKISSSLR
jgi:hypothetical protein